MTTIAWTGHRPKDLLDGINQPTLFQVLDKLGLPERPDLHFVTGGALGVDTWAANYAIARAIPFTLILPFTRLVMARFWDDDDFQTLGQHERLATEVVTIHEGGYDVSAYQRRNEAMVNRADAVYAIWTGKPFGGTANCIRYAQAVGREVYNLFPLDGKLHRL